MWISSGPGRVAAAVGFVATALLLALPWQAKSSRWENHVDASFIKQIVYRNGDLVMATNGGLLIYDIAADEFIQHKSVAGLPSNALNCLVFDGAGNLWVGTDDVGIAKLSIGESGVRVLRAFNEEFDGLAGNSILSVDLWDGQLVYGTETGAGLFDREIPSTRFFERDGLPSDVVNDVFAEGDDLWLATDGGVAVLDRLGFLTQPTDTIEEAYAVAKTPGTIWVGSGDGVWHMSTSDSSWTRIGPFDIRIHSFYWDGQAMWAGGTRAFYDYDGAQWTEHRMSSKMNEHAIYGSGGEVRTFVRTPAGELYIGAGEPSAGRGVNLLRYTAELEELRPNTPGGNKIIRLSRDVDGSVWISVRNFGVGKLTPAGKWVNYNTSIPESDSLSNLFVNNTMLADSEGFKWFSTMTVVPTNPKPLDQLDDKLDDDYSNDVWTRHPLGSGGLDGYGSLRPQYAVEDPAGNLWFLSDDIEDVPDGWRGINILNKASMEWRQVNPSSAPEMAAGNVSHVAFGEDVVYLALTNYGVQSWKTGGYDWASLKDLSDDVWGDELDAQIGGEGQLPSAAVISSLALRSDGVLWIGTDKGVVKHTPPSSFRLIDQRQGIAVGLLGPDVRFIVLDHYENLWVATSLGLNRISRDDDNDIEAYSTAAAYQSVLFKLRYAFSVISPLANADCYALMMHPTKDLLYVGTFGGLSVFDISPAVEKEANLSQVYVYPNPLDGSLQHGDLKIGNISGPVSIDIYNIEGDLVHSQTAGSPGEVIWDLTTNAGFIAASGVYFVRISVGSQSIVKPVSIIR